MKTVLFFTLVLGIGISSPSHASVSDQEFSRLQTELMDLMKRVQALETENEKLKNTASVKTEDMAESGAAPRSPSTAARTASSSWANSMKWKGDFRYRYEEINIEKRADRSRNRIRGRFALIATLPNDVEVGFGMATGGDDPVSTNQTLGGGASTKDTRLDLAYFRWSATPQLALVAGKFKNIWYRPSKTELMWDSDYNPEGFAATWKTGGLFVNGGLNWLESDSKRSNTRFLWGLQGGFRHDIGSSSLTAGAGFFNIAARGESPFFDDDFAGNSFLCADRAALLDCTYANDFEEVEVFAHLKSRLGSLPLEWFGDYVNNRAASRFDTAWATGFKLGKASRPGSWEVSWAYQDLEADALLGLSTNSDFAGGGADNKGHIFRAFVAVNQKWKVGFTYFLNQRNGNLGIEEDYRRLQVDTKFKF